MSNSKSDLIVSFINSVQIPKNNSNLYCFYDNHSSIQTLQRGNIDLILYILLLLSYICFLADFQLGSCIRRIFMFPYHTW